jgi:hypothetical protein
VGKPAIVCTAKVEAINHCIINFQDAIPLGDVAKELVIHIGDIDETEVENL